MSDNQDKLEQKTPSVPPNKRKSTSGVGLVSGQAKPQGTPVVGQLPIEIPPDVDPSWFRNYLRTRRNGFSDDTNENVEKYGPRP